MTWADEIDYAMRRGNSPYDVLDLLRWMREGKAEFWVGAQMHASGVVLDEQVHVGHLYGAWSNNDVERFWRNFREMARERGVHTGRIDGRYAWRRFLRMKGFGKCL